MKLRLHALPDTDLQLSTFCYGLGDLFALPQNQSDALLDAFVEAGGNFFDSAHCYSFWLPGGNGQSEIGIGDYVRRRGLEGAVIASKGGHPGADNYRRVEKYLSPERIGADIDDSLGRLQTDSIALYYLHRDDPQTPVSEIMDALNAEVKRGRIQYLGASNWDVKRIEAANTYARQNNLSAFVISEPRWSLAASSSGADLVDLNVPGQIEWHQKSGLAVAPYSPAAGGFFAAREGGDYATPSNLERRARAQELARKYDVTPNGINLAWLLNHPFPVFPITGTKNLEHLRASLAADELTLTPEEFNYLAEV